MEIQPSEVSHCQEVVHRVVLRPGQRQMSEDEAVDLEKEMLIVTFVT